MLSHEIRCKLNKYEIIVTDKKVLEREIMMSKSSDLSIVSAVRDVCHVSKFERGLAKGIFCNDFS